MITLEADVRLRPTEPDLRETRRIGVDVVRKVVSVASRWSLRILPSSTVRILRWEKTVTSAVGEVVVTEEGFDEI